MPDPTHPHHNTNVDVSALEVTVVELTIGCGVDGCPVRRVSEIHDDRGLLARWGPRVEDCVSVRAPRPSVPQPRQRDERE